MIKKSTVIIFFIALFLTSSVFAYEKNNNEIWNSDEGLKRLNRSHFNNDFYQLANFYQPQINPFFCSAATSTIILNALDYGNIPNQKELDTVSQKPLSKKGIEFHLYSQKTFFNDKTEVIKKLEIIELKTPKEKINDQEVYDPGLAIADLVKILTQVYKLKAELVYAEKNDEESIKKFRATAKKILKDKKSFLIINFDGKILGQKTRGHISPIAAYDEESDSLLILDVALHKNQWYFAPLTQVFAAMNTKDENQFRGYITVSR